MLGHTIFRMANKFTNQLRLSDVPTRDIPGMTDIVIYPAYEVNVGTRHGSVLVTNSMLDSNHISLQEILAAAEGNTERRVAIVPLEDRLRGMINVDAMPVGFESPFLVTYDREAVGEDQQGALLLLTVGKFQLRVQSDSVNVKKHGRSLLILL